MVAAMAAALDLRGTESVLEVGTGSGYSAAVLSLLAMKVYTIERYASLADSARQRLARFGYRNIYVYTDDGSAGLSSAAPFDAIAVAAAAPGCPSRSPSSLAKEDAWSSLWAPGKIRN